VIGHLSKFFFFIVLFLCVNNLEMAKELDKGKGIAETLKEIKDSDGLGAFHLAAAQGKTEICQYFVEDLKFDVDFRSAKGILYIYVYVYVLN
jgi:hypothetical protein